MSSSDIVINYAKFSGYESLAAAIVFAVLYVPLLLVFIKKALSQPTYVHNVLALFCAIRVTAFVIRAIMIKVTSAAQNLSLLIGDQILFGIGYAGLLYSSYTLVIDLGEEAANRRTGSEEPHFLRLTRNRHLFRLLMATAVALGIVASTTVSNDGTPTSTSTTLREASTAIFLVLTASILLQAIRLTKFDLSASRVSYGGVSSFGAKHGLFVIMAISVLLLVREVFITATVTPSSHAKQLDEHFWYPLIALPEILAVILFMTPGLVPTRDELAKGGENKDSMRA